MLSRPKSLLDLPNELLVMIKDSFGPHDFLGTACFYLLCKRTSVFYDKLTDAGWMRLLRANGLGTTTYEPLKDIEYKAIALECARHAWTCTHPQCGKARLRENRRYMEDAMVTWSSLSYNDTVKSPHFDVSPDEGPIVPSTIFSHIAFKPLHRGGIIDPSQEELAYLRPVDQDLRQTPPSETLDDHPIALRTFASFPPIETINVDSPFEIVRMLNRRGLVAKDVCRSLAMHMEQKVYSDSLKDSLHYLGLEVSRAFPWDLTTIEECVRQLQDWFKIVRWVGFEYQRPQRNRWFVLKFEPRELPKSEREIVGLFCSGVGT